jgi:hypothetical protein
MQPLWKLRRECEKARYVTDTLVIDVPRLIRSFYLCRVASISNAVDAATGATRKVHTNCTEVIRSMSPASKERGEDSPEDDSLLRVVIDADDYIRDVDVRIPILEAENRKLKEALRISEEKGSSHPFPSHQVR